MIYVERYLKSTKGNEYKEDRLGPFEFVFLDCNTLLGKVNDTIDVEICEWETYVEPGCCDNDIGYAAIEKYTYSYKEKWEVISMKIIEL
jgi:hypothetical protein